MTNKSCRYFTLTEGELLKCGLHIVAAFQRAQNGKGINKRNLTVEKQ